MLLLSCWHGISPRIQILCCNTDHYVEMFLVSVWTQFGSMTVATTKYAHKMFHCSESLYLLIWIFDFWWNDRDRFLILHAVDPLHWRVYYSSCPRWSILGWTYSYKHVRFWLKFTLLSPRLAMYCENWKLTLCQFRQLTRRGYCQSTHVWIKVFGRRGNSGSWQWSSRRNRVHIFSCGNFHWFQFDAIA